ncbi:MAG: VWA domain-containing protein [Oligoflexia bacterium]|nr:VWA domain-containing protein [Oligoflexia bacterium]
MKLVLSLLLVLFVAGCGQNYQFKPTLGNIINNQPPIVENPLTSGGFNFTLTANQVSFNQDVFATNTISTQFKITDQFGFPVTTLNKNQIKIKENNIEVGQFDLRLDNSGGNKTADIVVVLDVTTSMDPYIDELKRKIGRFVDALSQTNIKARLCLVTFGESTEDKCLSFVEDIPQTSKNENLEDFINKVSSIVTHGGGTEMNENQLLAMEDAATTTPWGNQAQRVAILITDAAFHYAPDNIGEGQNVPTYNRTLSVIQNAQMQSFIISFPTGGYDRPLKGQAAMPRATGGEFYNLGDIVGGLTDMEEIFRNIAAKISQGFIVDYVVDDNPLLNPELNINQRNIAIEIIDPNLRGTLTLQAVISSLPQGRPHYKKRFKISDKKIDAQSLKVFINSQMTQVLSISDTEVEFNQTPTPGSQIFAQYLLSNIKENLNLTPMEVKLNFIPKTVEVFANDKKLNSSEYNFTLNAQMLQIELSDKFFENISHKDEIKKRDKLELKYLIK